MRKLVTLLSLLVAALAGPASADARVRAYFTSRGDDLPGAIVEVFRQAERRAAEGREASIDIAVFSFTHFGIADELVRIAAEQPTVRVRVILDLSQLSHSENHVGPYLEDLKARDFTAACALRHPGAPAAERASCRTQLAARLAGADLSNLEIKYKWYDGYVFSTTLGRPVLDHKRSLLMHRKLAIVNGDILIAGSFNWSPQAATQNYENLIVLSGVPERGVIDVYRAEFEGMWNNAAHFKPGAECRALRQAIWERLRQENQ